MHRYPRRHHRVAAREAALSPRRQIVKLKKNGYKIAAAGLAMLVLLAIKWFAIGYFVGKRQ